MTTFIFLMSPEATSAQQTRMMSELEDRFPQHDFLIGDGQFVEYERNILALLDNTGGAPPNPEDVTEVVEFFRASLDGATPVSSRGTGDARHHIVNKAMEDAQAVLHTYVEPGPRDPEAVL